MTQKCVKHIAKTSNSKANNGVDNEQKVWHRRPENKARYKAYMRAYNQMPEVIARRKSYYPTNSFYKQYGMTMAEMGRRVGITKEAIRKRFIRGRDVTLIGKQKKCSYEKISISSRLITTLE